MHYRSYKHTAITSVMTPKVPATQPAPAALTRTAPELFDEPVALLLAPVPVAEAVAAVVVAALLVDVATTVGSEES